MLNHFKKIACILALLYIVAMAAQAQLISWAMKPGVYKGIERFLPGFFLVTNDEGMGVVNGNGDVIVEPRATRITGFYENKALVLKNEGKSERILGILSSNGSYVKVENKYYTIKGQELFSEGYLTVTDSSGKVAFMNSNGVIEKEFSDTSLSPFSEGFATVGEGDGFHIIDKKFNPVQIENLPFMGARIEGGTNVCNGKAILWDDYNETFVEYDVKNRKGTKIKKQTLDQIVRDFDDYNKWDYLGCLTMVSGRSSAIPYQKMPEEEVTCKATQQGGRYGYTSGATVILPSQLDNAEDFHGNNAIATLNGKTGLLVWRQSNGQFKAVASPREISYMKSEPANIVHKFSLTLPTLLTPDDISITVINPDGIERTVDCTGTDYEFTDQGRTETCTFPISINSDGLTMWEGTLNYSYTPKEAPKQVEQSVTLLVKLSMNNTRADENDQCKVTATVSNPTSQSITTVVSMTGSSLLQPTSKRVTIPANGSVKVSTYFMVRGRGAKDQWIKATTSDGSSHTLTGLELIPL